jgi:site-specific DNA-methyltransferase (adenine-specific)
MIDKLNNSVLQGDCLELMKDIPDGSVDLILSDLPYGTTNCKWDTIIPFEPLWEHYKRIIKPNGAIVLTASQPFTSALVMSNPKMFKYEWVWDKKKGGNIMNLKHQPYKVHENVLVFSKFPHIYNPIMTEQKERTGRTYSKGVANGIQNYGDIRRYNKKYPKSIIEESNANQTDRVHPTQKPVALFEYLIKTYTNEGDLVLDNVAGSGTTGVAALNTNRNYILMEKEPEYVEIIKQRLADHNDKPARQTKLLP